MNSSLSSLNFGKLILIPKETKTIFNVNMSHSHLTLRLDRYRPAAVIANDRDSKDYKIYRRQAVIILNRTKKDRSDCYSYPT